MNAPRYYRGANTTLWGIVIALALALALWFAGRATVAQIDASARDDERAKVLKEGAALRDASLSLAYRRWAHERDSLRALVDQRDTVLINRLRTVHDTAWLPADTAPTVRYAACRAQLDSIATECAAFRAAANRARLVSDSQHVADTSALRGITLQLAAVRRADSTKASRLVARSNWRAAERGACIASVGFNAFTILRKD